MERQILYYYSRGVASYLIAKKFGISNTQVRNIIKKSGVKIRSHNVTNKVSAMRRTPEENKAITQAATLKNTGTRQTSLHRVRLALSRQKSPTIDVVYEQPLVDMCKSLGIDCIPQKAFFKFNVDLYLTKENVVIEIFGGGFHNKTEAVDMFNNKMKYLSSKNIPVVVVWADKLLYSPQAVLQVALRATERLTIIDGQGNPSTRGYSFITSL
jgi:very-short-patch-repair endonuclease